MNYIKLLRIKHYVKNFLIFLPMFFAQELTDPKSLIQTFIGFITFSLVTSIVYIYNDLQDVEHDKLHPIKKNRPIASGKVKITTAKNIALLLVFISLSLSVFFKINLLSNLIISLYVISNILYSYKLKNVPLVDISIISMSYILRVLLGGTLVGIPISNWLILTVMSFSFFMAFGKRRNELIKNGVGSRKVLAKYNKEFLDKSMMVSETMFIVFYALWSLSENPFAHYNNLLIWTVPIISFITFRYSMIIESDSFGDPADILFSDKVLMTLILIYLSFIGFIYFAQ